MSVPERIEKIIAARKGQAARVEQEIKKLQTVRGTIVDFQSFAPPYKLSRMMSPPIETGTIRAFRAAKLQTNSQST